jgi:hypothetical protein
MSLSEPLRSHLLDSQNWLALLGITPVGVGLYIAWQELVVYDTQTQLILAGYIALQVAGWLAIIEWYRSSE